MLKSPLFYAIAIYLVALGLGVDYWLDGKREAESVVIQTSETAEVIPSKVVVEAAGDGDLLPVERVVATDLGSFAAAEQPEVLERPDRFTNESKIRQTLGKLKALAADDSFSQVSYDAYLLELEELMMEVDPKHADLLVLIQAELGAAYFETVEEAGQGQQLLADVERTFGFVWGQDDPEQSLNFARNASPHVLAGWLAGQIHAENDYPEMLASQKVTLTPEVYWEALMDIAKTDTILSLDTIMANHMDEMDLVKWKEILFSRGNSGDTILAAWFQENIAQLSQHSDFDEVEVVRMLRRFNYGDGPFMLSSDVERVEAAKAAKDYAGAARIMDELSALYGDTLDASAAGRFPLNWSKQDFAAASNWVLQNSEKFSDPESMQSMLGTMYRHKSKHEAELAMAMAHQIEDEVLRGLTLSNTLIPQMETSGAEVPVEWVSALPQGFAKQRTMAGYVLGLSRHSEEPTLEAQVKFQFLQDEFDLEQIQNQVLGSQLSNEEKISVVNLFNTY